MAPPHPRAGSLPCTPSSSLVNGAAPGNSGAVPRLEHTYSGKGPTALASLFSTSTLPRDRDRKGEAEEWGSQHCWRPTMAGFGFVRDLDALPCARQCWEMRSAARRFGELPPVLAPRVYLSLRPSTHSVFRGGPAPRALVETMHTRTYTRNGTWHRAHTAQVMPKSCVALPGRTGRGISHSNRMTSCVVARLWRCFCRSSPQDMGGSATDSDGKPICIGDSIVLRELHRDRKQLRRNLLCGGPPHRCHSGSARVCRWAGARSCH